MRARQTELEDAASRELEDLLRSCTAQIESRSNGFGTGFFIDADLVLTCAHVAEGSIGDAVTVHLKKGRSLKGKIIKSHPDRVDDVALIRIEAQDADSNQPAVAISASFAYREHFFHSGYPKGEMDAGSGKEDNYYTASARIAHNDEIDRWVIQSGGDSIRQGQSGGALLSRHYGVVVGLMQFSNERGEDAGGGGIPIGRALHLIEEVRQFAHSPPPSTKRWRNVLGRDLWEINGWTWGQEEVLDLHISGDPSSWKVKFSTDDEACGDMKGSALPENISEALFAWAQSKRLKEKEDLELLGSLLGAALFPEPVLNRLRTSFSNDHLLIRIHFDEDSVLADVPWEFASVELENKVKLIGAVRNVSFVRMVKTKKQPEVRTVPPTHGTEQLMSIIIAPDTWISRMPKKQIYGSEIDWPKQEKLLDRLKESASKCRRYSLMSEENPRLSELRDHLDRARDNVDIVHYMGFGHFDGGQAWVIFSNGHGGVQRHPLEDFLDILGVVNPRLLHMQFLLPPPDFEYEPIPPGFFREAIKRTLNAVIYTRTYLHPHQTNQFNQVFYKSLGNGLTVERAVQSARSALHTDNPLDDRACFGAFSLLTGQVSHMRFGRIDDADPADATSSRMRGEYREDRRHSDRHRLSSQKRGERDEFTEGTG